MRYDAWMASLSRRQIQVALFCYTAFLLYATLWPFDFHFARAFVAGRKISWIPFFDPAVGPERRDAVLNILVFLPFGFLSCLVNSASGKFRRPVLVATLLGSALSFFVETSQIGLPSRDPSTADLLMNTTGALLGALSARAVQRKIHSDPEGFRLRIRKNAVPLGVIAYALALLASTMRTFDPILNWKFLRFRAMAFAGSSLLPDHLDLDYTAWMVLAFGFLSFLAAEGVAGSSRIRRRFFRYIGVFVVCSLYAIFLETMQILFRSRSPLLSHALLGVIGVAYGIAWHAIADPFRAAGGTGPIHLFIHYTLLIFLAFLSPIPHAIGGFRFDFHGLIPLYFYLRNISLPSFYAAVKTVVLYIPVGFIMYRGPNGLRDRTCKISVGFSVGLQGTIELCSGFFGHRYPDPSNIFLAALGAYAGIRLANSIGRTGTPA